MNFSKNVTVTEVGGKVIDIDASDLHSVLFTVDQDCYWGWNDVGQAIFPIVTGNSLAITWLDFQEIARRKIKITSVYFKRQVAGSANVSIAYLGLMGD